MLPNQVFEAQRRQSPRRRRIARMELLASGRDGWISKLILLVAVALMVAAARVVASNARAGTGLRGPPTYVLRVLSPLSQGTLAEAAAINSRGDVIGLSGTLHNSYVVEWPRNLPITVLPGGRNCGQADFNDGGWAPSDPTLERCCGRRTGSSTSGHLADTSIVSDP